MKKRLLVLALVISLLASLALPRFTPNAGAAPQVHQQTASHLQAFDKTRFLLHLGLAYFAFHHWVYKPFKDHKLGRFHIINDIKAGLALLFAYHEVKVALGIAKGSNSKTLHLIIAPITALGTAFAAVAGKLKHGDTSGVASLSTRANSVYSLSAREGFNIVDQQTKIKGVG